MHEPPRSSDLAPPRPAPAAPDGPIRRPRRAELPALAALWHDAWHEVHDPFVPPALVAVRTPASFRRRLAALHPGIRAAADAAGPLGFCAIRAEGPGEIDQLFLAPRARGTGLAARLLADGEARLRAAGCTRPILNCLPENARARAFYRRQGWEERGIERVPVSTRAGPVAFTCIVLEKRLG